MDRLPKWQGGLRFITTSLCSESIALEEIDDGLWSLWFMAHLPGRIDLRTKNITDVRMNLDWCKRCSSGTFYRRKPILALGRVSCSSHLLAWAQNFFHWLRASSVLAVGILFRTMRAEGHRPL